MYDAKSCETGPATFLQTCCFKSANYELNSLYLYPIDLNNQGHNTKAFSQNEADKNSLKAYY